MSELRFESNLSMEEIEKNFEGVNFFDGIMDGLNEALAYEQGTAKANTFARKNSLPNVNSADIRKNLNVTQREFADILGVSPRTVEAWECGKSIPNPTAKKLMFLINNNHSLIQELK